MHQCTKAISVVLKTLFIHTQIRDYKVFHHIHQRNKTEKFIFNNNIAQMEQFMFPVVFNVTMSPEYFQILFSIRIALTSLR